MFKRVLSTLALGLALAAQAQTFPTKPVRIITPFPVGSGPEGVARLVADKLSKNWGQPVTVENRPGGNGFIAIDAFKRGASDGHDLPPRELAVGRTGCEFSSTKPSEALRSRDADLALRAGTGVARDFCLDCADCGLELFDAAVLDRLVAEADAAFALGERGLQCLELGFCVGHQRYTVRLISEESSNDADVVAQLMSTY